jgi:dihydrofolate reductase
MGRKTYESIGKPLPNRHNLILTTEDTQIERCSIALSIDEVLYYYENFLFNEDMWIIGGNSVYTQFLPYADNLFITEIDHEFEGDAFFPEYDKTEWKLLGEQKGVKDEENPYDYSFKIYTRQMEE